MIADHTPAPAQTPPNPITLRFAQDSVSLVQRAADTVGSPFSQFVREAALMRAIVVLGDESELSRMSQLVDNLPRWEDSAPKRTIPQPT